MSLALAQTNNFSREEYKSDNSYIAAILNEHGINKQTAINEKAGEATFVDYAGALNDKLTNALLNGGFGETDGLDESELAIRENIANIYRQKGSSAINTNDLIKMIKSMGYTVSSSYISTSYIVDNKNDGHYDTDIHNGAINVLTITDAEGNDIVIADANGNAAIEIEELFIDEIITGAISTIENMEFKEYSSVSKSAFDSARDAMAFDVSFVVENEDSSDIWLEHQLARAEKEEEKQQILKEQQEKIEKAKKEKKIKDAEIEKQEAQALLEAKQEAEKAYNKEMKKFKENYFEELKNNEEYADYSDKELEQLALEEAAQYCKKKLGYKLA
ncbi:MAG: hypothetical protein IKU37_00945 [Candidatus Gastranaerophilales bacterium]|nr:hypothetical protein [Candidatus Gastranaerophilales bacterium]